MISKLAKDEMLILNEYSIKIFISKLIDFINENIKYMLVENYLTNDLMMLKRTDGIDKKHLEKINEQ